MRWIDRLLLFITALVTLVSLMPLGARWSWALELTTHFRVQYLAVTAAMLAILLARRHFTACGVLVAAAAVSAAPVLPYLPLAPAPPASAAAAPLKVVTVNVSYLPFLAKRFLEIVRETSPDVLVLQELTPHAERVLADLDGEFTYHRKFPADGAYGIGLWSRFPIESSATFALGRVPAIEARLEGPYGPFNVIGVHLRAPTTPRRAEARNQELRQLAARSAAVEEPLIVAGDFNITPYSPYFRDWLKESGLTDSRRGRTLSVSWPTTLPWFGIPIDHVAVNDGFTIHSHSRLPNFQSDHFGVLVELAFREAERR